MSQYVLRKQNELIKGQELQFQISRIGVKIFGGNVINAKLDVNFQISELICMIYYTRRHHQPMFLTLPAKLQFDLIGCNNELLSYQHTDSFIGIDFAK